MTAPTDSIAAFVREERPLEEWERAAVLTAFEDTLAVAYAGWNEPAARSARALYPADFDALLTGNTDEAPDAEAMVLATAGHALDYDDVQLTSVTHPSVVLVPALLALANRGLGPRERLAQAFAVGLAVNVWLGRVLGFAHYSAGWHATSTIGPVAAAAAAAHLLQLDDRRTRSALAMAAAQSAGMQINFGTDAKPLQAGFAAAAAVRAVLLVRAGASAADDVLAPRGLLDLYGGAGATKAAQQTPEIDLSTISRKLFPCCYAAHRMVAAALELHPRLGDDAETIDRIVCRVPQGLLTPLRVADPRSGNEAKFCGPYLIAAPLAQGYLGLADFSDEGIRRERVRRLMAKVVWEEDQATAPGVEHGAVRLSVLRAGEIVGEATVRHHPGSPQRPASAREMQDKIADCLEYAVRAGGAAMTVEDFRTRVCTIIGLSGASRPATEGMTS